jgi:ribonuclease HI
MVKQLTGAYKVKNEGLKPLHRRAVALLGGFSSFTVSHIRRAENAEADAMANQAMDERTIVGSPACEPGGEAPQGSLF